MEREKSELLQVAEKFEIEGTTETIEPHGNGHINDTFLLTCRLSSDVVCRYILQRMNHEVFKDPKALMENIHCILFKLIHINICNHLCTLLFIYWGRSFFKKTPSQIDFTLSLLNKNHKKL